MHQTWGSFSVNDVSAATPVYFGFVDDDIARDPEVRDLLDKGDNSVDPDVRKEAYKKALAAHRGARLRRPALFAAGLLRRDRGPRLQGLSGRDAALLGDDVEVTAAPPLPRAAEVTMPMPAFTSLEALGLALLVGARRSVARLRSLAAPLRRRRDSRHRRARARGGGHRAIRRSYGLDRPLVVQYLDWLWRTLRGDFGTSLYFKTDVIGLVLGQAPDDAAPRRPLARLRARCLDPARRCGGGLPEQLDRSPRARARGGRAGAAELLLRAPPDHAVLDPAALAAGLGQRHLGAFRHADDRARLLRRAGLHAARRAPAWSRCSRPTTSAPRAPRGCPARTVVFKHALRNAVVPVVALAAVQLGFLLGGSVVIETIFALDGLGYLAYQSITHKDFPVTQAVVMLLSVVLRPPDARGRPRERLARSAHPGRAMMADAALQIADDRPADRRRARCAARVFGHNEPRRSARPSWR